MTRLGSAGVSASLNGLDGTGATNTIGNVALNVGDPGTTGASENANAGSYARQACTWNASSAGSNKTNSTSLSWSTLGTIAVSHFSCWSSASYGAGNYGIGGALGATITAATITAAAAALSIGSS